MTHFSRLWLNGAKSCRTYGEGTNRIYYDFLRLAQNEIIETHDPSDDWFCPGARLFQFFNTQFIIFFIYKTIQLYFHRTSLWLYAFVCGDLCIIFSNKDEKKKKITWLMWANNLGLLWFIANVYHFRLNCKISLDSRWFVLFCLSIIIIIY